MKKHISYLLLLSILSFDFLSCKYVTNTESSPVKTYAVKTSVIHPDWSESAVIYEVNIRQYTAEGTFSAFIEHLPRLKTLGVDILWLMPIYPIGVKNRKGTLGSYYSIEDYMKVNPEFGTIDDLKDLVKEAHGLDMYVILDWVGNHSAWDNPLFAAHPLWYKQDSLGRFVSPYNWTDVVRLNYNNPELCSYMLDAMKFWVEEADIDGYRCDFPGLVPVDFWNKARTELDALKPVFMLTDDEAHTSLVEKAFDMNYGWELHHIMNSIAKGEKKVKDLKTYFTRLDSIYDPAIYRLNFITNHDENSWNGTEFERLGDAVEVFALLTFTVPGMPLIYSGQEVGMQKRLRFFDKDTINWEDNQWSRIYKNFIELKKEHSVFWNGAFGGSFKIIDIKGAKQVFAFTRENDYEKTLVLLNLSNKTVNFKLKNKKLEGHYFNYFTSDAFDINDQVNLKPYDYLVFLEEF
jgi:glycosidase